MLTIRLSRHGRKKRPFYRVVLTEHTKSAKAWYKEVLGYYDPLKHELKVDVEAIKWWIAKGSQMSEKAAKLLYNETKDDLFKKFFVIRERVREIRNPSEEQLAKMEAEKKALESKKVEEKKEEVKEEVKKEEKSAE